MHVLTGIFCFLMLCMPLKAQHSTTHTELDSVKARYEQKLKQKQYKTLDDKNFETGNLIRIPIIFYDLGKATLRPEAKDSLHKVASFLKAHPELIVEIGCHLDSRVSPYSSYRVDGARAKSCADYLCNEQHVDPGRITARGYSYFKPLFTDEEIKKLNSKQAIEEAYSHNRRTELKVLYVRDTVSHVINWADSTYILFHKRHKITDDLIVPGIAWYTEIPTDSIRLVSDKNYALDEVADYVNANPRIVVELCVFINCPDRPECWKRENNRASAIYSYLEKEKGISPDHWFPKPQYLPDNPKTRAKWMEYRKKEEVVIRLLKLE